MTKAFGPSSSCSARLWWARRTHFPVARHLDTAHFGHELRLLPAVEQFRADAQLLRGGLRAAALRGQTQGLGLEGIVVLAPFIWPCLALFCGYDSGNRRPASVRLT